MPGHRSHSIDLNVRLLPNTTPGKRFTRSADAMTSLAT
jgi:hypothetical protein